MGAEIFWSKTLLEAEFKYIGYLWQFQRSTLKIQIQLKEFKYGLSSHMETKNKYSKLHYHEYSKIIYILNTQSYYQD